MNEVLVHHTARAWELHLSHKVRQQSPSRCCHAECSPARLPRVGVIFSQGWMPARCAKINLYQEMCLSGYIIYIDDYWCSFRNKAQQKRNSCGSSAQFVCELLGPAVQNPRAGAAALTSCRCLVVNIMRCFFWGNHPFWCILSLFK